MSKNNESIASLARTLYYLSQDEQVRYLCEQRLESERTRLTYEEDVAIAKQLLEDEMQKVEAERQKVKAERQKAEAERQKAEAERQKTEAERQKAEVERQKAEAERQKAEAERQKAEQAEQQIAKLLAENAALREQLGK